MEMDLQASILCGRMPSACEADFTCCSPGNFRDEDLCEEMAEYPSPRPLDEWTSSLVQAVLGRSLSLRLKAMRVMAGITAASSRMSSALDTAEQLERFIDTLPEVLRIQRSWKHGFSRVFRLVLCDLHLRRPLICLWQKLASMVSSDRVSIDARLGSLRSSMTVLSHRSLFDHDQPSSQPKKAIRKFYGNWSTRP